LNFRIELQVNSQARPAGPDLVRRALRGAAGAGPYFVVSVGEEGGPWRPAAELYAGGLAGLIARTGAQLGVTEARVAASTVQLGYAARLWSPVLGCLLRDGIVPDLTGLRTAAGSPMRLNLPEPRGWLGGGAGAQAALAYQTVITGHLEPLAGGLPVKVAAGLLRGNAAAAMTAALRVLACTRPDLAPPARALAQRLLATGLLRGTGELTGPGLEFTRRSCCLFYRVPGGGLCGDCPLPRPADHSG
jgi:FhuF 2Fe-2S C-terminal domain